MTFLLFWLFFSIAAGMFAHIRRSRNGVGWFFVAFLLSPIIAFVLLAILQPRSPLSDLEADERHRRFDNGVRAVIVAIVIVIAFAAVSTYMAAAQQSSSRSFYDRNGSFAGSSTMRGNATSFSDRNGHFGGSAIKNSDGTTSFYDRNGRFIGSTADTTPRR